MNFLYKKFDTYPDEILVREFVGEVDVNEIIKSWEYLIESKLLGPGHKGVINNISNCRLVMNMESFKILIDYLKNNINLRKLKLAVITDNPTTIVFPTLAELEEKELKVKVFSTIEAAVHWIKFE